ncbi:ABC transporter permease, partial [Streptomyces sp. SID5998]|nr:ABC transporter permease [Streptomyces sp. SID5998]
EPAAADATRPGAAPADVVPGEAAPAEVSKVG